MFRALRLLQITVLATTVLSFSGVHAQNNPLTDLAQKLQEDRMKAEHATTESQTQITEIESQKAALDVKKREIEEANAKNMEAVKKELSPEALDELVPTTPEQYLKLYGEQDLDQLKTAAGLPVDTKAPKNDFTESLRNLAGIIRN